MNMKTLLLLIILPLSVIGQHKFQNFVASASESSIYWQKVYESDAVENDIIHHLRSNGYLQEVSDFGSTIKGVINGIVPSLAGTGIKNKATGIEFKYIVYDASFLVELKEGKYRVTIDNIFARYVRDGVFGREGEKTPLIQAATTMNGKRINPSFEAHTAVILDVNFNNIFELKNNNEDNW